MSKRFSTDDVSVFLYMIPFIGSFVYALYLGVVDRVSSVLSSSIYLTVTRDPFLFLLGTFSVMLGIVFEVSSAAPTERSAKLGSVGKTLQSIAVASFILALACSLYAHGFSNVSAAASDFIAGRFSLVFPLMMVLLSYLITVRINLSSIGTPTFLGIVAMLLVPVSVYEVGKRNTALGLAGALILIIVGLGLFIKSNKKTSDDVKASGVSR
jgi:hypothetical protein